MLQFDYLCQRLLRIALVDIIIVIHPIKVRIALKSICYRYQVILIEEVIRVFHVYQKWHNADSRLFIVGDYQGFERYYWALKDFVAELGVQRVHFTGHVTNEDVVAYYRMSDLFICLSEHEGFCVPLLEAFHFGLPVIAWQSSAVGETLRGAGILFKEKDYGAMAKAAETLRRDKDFREEILRGQREVLASYDPAITGRLLLDYVNQVAARI